MPMPVNKSDASKDVTPSPIPDVGTVELRSYEPGDEAAISAILNACHVTGWGNESFWRWKHAQRPNFSADDVILTVIDGRIAGCFHGAILPVQLEEGLEVPMCFEGDFAVLPEYRKAGLPLLAHDLADRRLLDAGVVLRGGFTSHELNEKFYHRRFGYVFVPTVTTGFRKILGLGPLQEKVARLNDRLLRSGTLGRLLRGIQLTIDLTIDQFPPSHLEISEHRVALHSGCAAIPHMKVLVPYSLLVASRRGLRTLVPAVLSGVIRGRVRLRGLLRNANLLARLVARLLWNRDWKRVSN
jgi:hypothetical protein